MHVPETFPWVVKCYYPHLLVHQERVKVLIHTATRGFRQHYKMIPSSQVDQDEIIVEKNLTNLYNQRIFRNHLRTSHLKIPFEGIPSKDTPWDVISSGDFQLQVGFLCVCTQTPKGPPSPPVKGLHKPLHPIDDNSRLRLASHPSHNTSSHWTGRWESCD
jgi:hypothetical protein